MRKVIEKRQEPIQDNIVVRFEATEQPADKAEIRDVEDDLTLAFRSAWLHRESTELATMLSTKFPDLVAVKDRLKNLIFEADSLREKVKTQLSRAAYGERQIS